MPQRKRSKEEILCEVKELEKRTKKVIEENEKLEKETKRLFFL